MSVDHPPEYKSRYFYSNKKSARKQPFPEKKHTLSQKQSSPKHNNDDYKKDVLYQSSTNKSPDNTDNQHSNSNYSCLECDEVFAYSDQHQLHMDYYHAQTYN